MLGRRGHLPITTLEDAERLSGDADPRVRAAALAAVGRLKRPGRSRRVLREALHDRDRRVRLAAAEALADTGDLRAAAVLVREG